MASVRPVAAFLMRCVPLPSYQFLVRHRAGNASVFLCKISLSRDLKIIPGQAILIAKNAEKMY